MWVPVEQPLTEVWSTDNHAWLTVIPRFSMLAIFPWQCLQYLRVATMHGEAELGIGHRAGSCAVTVALRSKALLACSHSGSGD